MFYFIFLGLNQDYSLKQLQQLMAVKVKEAKTDDKPREKLSLLLFVLDEQGLQITLFCS